MKSVTFHSHVGADGILNLQVPVGIINTELEVMVIVQPTSKPPKYAGWLPGFFEDWAGEPLVRPEQGEYEIREELK
jgi:hypothetical protein